MTYTPDVVLDRATRTLIFLSNDVREADRHLTSYVGDDVRNKLDFIGRVYPNIQILSREKSENEEESLIDDYWALLCHAVKLG